MDRSNCERVLTVSALAARLLLESGAEIYRVEETVYYICKKFGFTQVQVLALPTGVIYTLQPPEGEALTRVVRVHARRTDLSRISQVNSVSRALTDGRMDLEKAQAALTQLAQQPPQPLLVGMAAAAVSAGFFSLLFGGGWFDLLIAGLCGALTRAAASFYGNTALSTAVYCLASGALTALTALTSVALFGMGNQNAIIVGAIMPLLPGLIMTNAIRDTVNGDLISGVARTADALIKTVAIAAGVGMVLALWLR